MIELSDQGKQEFELMSEAIGSESALKLALFSELLRKHEEAANEYFHSDWDQLSDGEIHDLFVTFNELDKQLINMANELKREGLSL